MLWRHLAYRDPLLEKLEAGAEPLDDDSDLEFELEAFPAVSDETSAETAACVKILISSGLPNETGTNRSTVEVPLPTNIPNGQTSCAASDKQLARSNRGANTTMTVSLQKQPQAAAPLAELLDGNGSASANGPSKKKRKLWTKEEDMELIAAVDKCGEGNWANILKGDFKHDRTASQLSQRWSIIRKKRANFNAGSGCNATSSAPTETHVATWQAVNMAIKMPIIGGLSARRPGSTGVLQSTDAANAPAPPAAASEATTAFAPEVPNQPHQAHNQTASQKGAVNPLNKSRTSPKMATITVKPLGGPTSIIQAAAFAAGGRIATPSTAASHFKAAQSKNAVHIRPGGALASSTPSSKPLSSTTTVGPQPSNIRCNKAPISPKDHAMTTSGPRTTGHQGMCSSSDLLSPSCDATPSNQQPIEHVQIKLSPGLVCADAEGNEEPRSTGAILDTCGALSKEENKCTEEIQLDTPVSHDHVDLLNLDVDPDKAGVAQIGGSKAAGGCTQVGAEPEIAFNNSDLPCVDMTEEAVVAIKSRHEDPMEITRVPIGGMAEKQVAVANNQMHNSEAVTVVAEESETSEETASQYPLPGDDGTV